MLKKLIVYILAASILLTVPVSYAETTTETADNVYTVQLFESLGIIDNADDYLKRLDEQMTRGEFAILAAGLYNGTGLVSGYQPFRDVPADHKASKAVNLLANNGIISGTDNGLFEPDKTIEYSEALSIVLKMLGYGDFIGYNGGYPSGCYTVVNKFKLFAYSNLTTDSTVRNIFQLLFETAKENVMEITSVGSGYNNSDISRTKTLLSIYFDVYNTEGVLTSDGIVDIKSTSTPERDEIKIDGTSYKSENSFSEYLGQNVICFYKENITTKKTAICIVPTEENEILVVDAQAAYSFDNMIFMYEKANGKSAKIKITSQMDIIYNYSVASTLSQSIMLPENGVIKFIDNDADSNYDVVIIKSYTSFLIGSVSTYDDGIKLYANTARNVPVVNIIADGEADTLIYDKNGAPADIAGITKGMVASVSGNVINGELKAKEVILCKDSLFGDITGSEDDGDKYILYIDDMPHKVASTYVEIAKNSGYRYGVNFYLDFMGNIVDIAEGDMTMLDLAIGYIIDVDYDDSGLDDVFQIKMMTEANKIVIYDVNEITRIDGQRKKNLSETYSALGGSQAAGQLVSYKISENRKINYVDTAAELTGEISDNYFDRLTITVPMRSLYYQKEQFSFDGDITIDENTRVFVIPQNPQEADDSDYEVIKNTEVAGSLTYELESYSLNNDKITADAIIIKASTQSMPTSSVAMAIKNISKVINEEGDETYAVTLVGMKGEEKHTTVDNTIIENAPAQSASDTNTYKLEVGDIVRITTNKENEINKIMLVYDYSSGELKNGMAFAGSYFSRSRAAKTSVYNIQGDYMQITDYDLSTLAPGEVLNYDHLENQKLSKFAVVKYDITRDKLNITKGSAGDLIAYKNNDAEYSKIVIYTENAVERVIFVLD